MRPICANPAARLSRDIPFSRPHSPVAPSSLPTNTAYEGVTEIFHPFFLPLPISSTGGSTHSNSFVGFLLQP